MRLLRFIRTASREANFLAASAAILLLVKILVLNRYPEKFFRAYELGVIAEAVLASVVASYVFYLLVVHSKEQADRDILRPYVEKHSKRVVGDCISQLREISKTSGIALDFSRVSEAEVSAAFSKIAPYSQAPLLLSAQSKQHANWFQYLLHHEARSKGSIRKLLDQLPFLDTKLVGIITAIDDCSHFSGMSILVGVQVSNPDLSVWAKTFHEYCVLCRQLNSHIVGLGFSSAAP